MNTLLTSAGMYMGVGSLTAVFCAWSMGKLRPIPSQVKAGALLLGMFWPVTWFVAARWVAHHGVRHLL